MRSFVLAMFLSLAIAACQRSAGAAKLVDAAPTGDVAAIVRAQVASSNASGRTALVYVGAAWCEPCERFREAVKKGELNDVFGKVDFVVFDLDKDAARLEAANYSSRMIPLVVVPGADGRGTDRRIEGSIKGEGAVAHMKPRVQGLLQ